MGSCLLNFLLVRVKLLIWWDFCRFFKGLLEQLSKFLLIISVVVTIHKNSPILNWPQIVTSNDLLKCCYNLATLFRTQAVKKFAHRFLTISCSGGSMVSYFFHLVNLKLVSRPM